MNVRRAPKADLAAMTPAEAAAHWFVREDAQAMTADDRNIFDAWLAESAEHRRAYGRIRMMWSGFEHAVDDSELRALRVGALAAGPEPRVWPRAMGIAAGMVVAILGIAVLTWQMAGSVRVAEAPGEGDVGRYSTARDQRSSITLPDGTAVSMNLDTVVEIDFTAERRLVHLTKGQAFFDVAKDEKRPFIVAAAERHIQALGTKFDVRLNQDQLEVVLLEGRVKVERDQPSLMDRILHRSTRMELKPNQRWIATRDETPSIMTIDAERVTSWREGWIVFEDETVEQVIAELNRYSEHQIVAADDVGQMRLSGVFRIGEPGRFGAIMQELLSVAVEQGPQGETVLVRRR